MRDNSIKPHHLFVHKPFIPFHINIILRNRKGSRDMYNTLIYEKNNTNTAKEKWISINPIFSNINWKMIISLPFKITKDSSIQWFIFRLLSRILPLNHYLKTIGVRQNDLCNFCKTSKETIEHLFYNCQVSQKFWPYIYSFKN